MKLDKVYFVVMQFSNAEKVIILIHLFGIPQVANSGSRSSLAKRFLKRFVITWDHKPGSRYKWPPMDKDRREPSREKNSRWPESLNFVKFEITWDDDDHMRSRDEILDVNVHCQYEGPNKIIRFPELISSTDELWYVPNGLTTLHIQRVHHGQSGGVSYCSWPPDATLITTKRGQIIYHIPGGTKITTPLPRGAELFLVQNDLSDRYRVPLLQDLKTGRTFYKIPINFPWGYILSETQLPDTITITKEEFIATNDNGHISRDRRLQRSGR